MISVGTVYVCCVYMCIVCVKCEQSRHRLGAAAFTHAFEQQLSALVFISSNFLHDQAGSRLSVNRS